MGIEYKNHSESEEKVMLLTDELNVLKAKFIQSDQLAQIGKLSAGIFHEIKNPLNFIINFTKLSQDLSEEMKDMMKDLGDIANADSVNELLDIGSMLDTNLQKILENGERAQRIITTMLAQINDNQETVFAPTNINQLIDEFTKLAYQGVRANDSDFNVAIKTDYDATIGMINIGAQEISRVIINIINNACYALNEKKKVLKDSFSPEISISTKKQGGTVEIRIKDNGTGIPKNVIEKLFTPFFTTKPAGQGTGLGLSLSYDIITKVHKGKIQILSKENEYTEFVINLPL
ncbi:MAG: hypothetical protein JEZ09_06235 [Salinivirgaceae bacterium]|nr:hypothetical protein [Salinivirgaceae bacterium]